MLMGRLSAQEDAVRRGRKRRRRWRDRCICYCVAPVPVRVVEDETVAEILCHHMNPVVAAAVAAVAAAAAVDVVGKVAPSVCVSACVWVPFDNLLVPVKVRDTP
jgi:hypothetical protein